MKKIKLKLNKFLKAINYQPERMNSFSLAGKLKADKGFTLLESLVAITIFTLGVSASVGSVMHLLKLAPIIESKLIAAHLAQEGIELVRNIRDSNWIAGDSWNVDLVAGSGCVQYDQTIFDIGCFGNSAVIKSDGSYYSHNVGTDTIFSRQITIAYPVAEEMVVQSHVACGPNCDVSLEDHLFDWK